MLDKLIDLLASMWSEACPLQIVDCFKAGVHLRFGKFIRVLEPGLRWKIPLVDKFMLDDVVIDTAYYKPQALTTLDNKMVVVSAVVKYQVVDIKKYLLDIYDRDSVLADSTMMAMKQIVSSFNWESLRHSKEVEKELRSLVAKEVKDYGIKVHRVVFADLSLCRTYRLISDAK